MIKISSIMATMTIAALLISCTTQGRPPTQLASNIINRESVIQMTHDTYPAKNPQLVSLYTNNNKPHAAYRVIGVAKVSKYNILGERRQDETVHTMMKNLAASIGGDGLIDVNHTEQETQANIIAYQKILI
jgi:hypothetical protein